MTSDVRDLEIFSLNDIFDELSNLRDSNDIFREIIHIQNVCI